MRKLLIRIVLFLLAFPIAGWIRAQDPVFSQFYAMPMQINPGFAGSSIAPRMGIAYRNQWTGFNSAYRTYAAYYEQPFERLNSGIGFQIESDDAGNGILKTTNFSATYAYRLQVNDDIAAKMGMEVGIHQTNLDWAKLVFPDQVDAYNGITYNSNEITPEISGRTRLDLGAGLLLVGKHFQVGGALKHVNTPNDAILLTNDNLSEGLPIRYMLHGGTELIVKKGNKLHAASFISPNFLFVAQGPYKQLNVGAYADGGMFFGGAWFRHTFRNVDAVIVSAGFRKDVFKLGLSYDFTVSGLSRYAGSTFELTGSILLDQNERIRNKKKRVDLNDCLRMFQ